LPQVSIAVISSGPMSPKSPKSRPMPPMSPKSRPMLSPMSPKGTRRRTSKANNFEQKPGRERYKKVQKINVFVQSDWLGEVVTLKIGPDKTIGELKRTLCSDHGFVPDLHWLADSRGVRLDDVLALDDYGITKDATLYLSQRSARGPSSPRKRKPSLAELEEPLEEEEAPVGESARLSEEDMEEAFSSTLKKAFTRGGLHIRDLNSPNKNGREVARKQAQGKASNFAAHHRPPKDAALHRPPPDDLVSKVTEVAQQLFPSMFLQCAPTLAKRHHANMVHAPRGGA